MSTRCVLSIDQGTTNTKALLLDQSGIIRARASRPLKISYPYPAWVEEDPGDIWASVLDAIDKCLTQVPGVSLSSIGISNQRESVMLWDRRTGQPLGPVITWQCRRTSSFCDELRARGLEKMLHERTGLTIDPLFSASKMRALLERAPEYKPRAEAGELCLGTMDSWVAYKLTGGAAHVTDASNASRTQLLNFRRLEWDEELLRLFGIPRQALPQVIPSDFVAGTSVGSGALPAGVPIASLIGDSHAALFGQAGFRPGRIKATYGTGSSLMTPTMGPVLSERGISTTVAWQRGTEATYALEGNILVTGSAVQWLADLLGLPDAVAGVERLAGSVESTDGVYLVPAFVGLGAPYWDDTARGLITGITRGTTAAHLARATLESIAYQIRDVFELMQAEAGVEMEELLADGGASRNDQLMQFQADILGCVVLRTKSPDVSALGAAYLAGLAVGFWSSDEEIVSLPRERDCFEPKMTESVREKLIVSWREAVARTRYCPGLEG